MKFFSKVQTRFLAARPLRAACSHLLLIGCTATLAISGCVPIGNGSGAIASREIILNGAFPAATDDRRHLSPYDASRPFASLAVALKACRPGDTLSIRSGVYVIPPEGIEVRSRNFSLQGDPGAIIRTATPHSPGITLRGPGSRVSDITFDGGRKNEPPEPSPTRYLLKIAAPDITVERCQFNNYPGTALLLVDQADRCLVEHSSFSNVSTGILAIELENAGSAPDDNKFLFNHVTTIDTSEACRGIKVATNHVGTTAKGNLIEGNTLRNAGYVAIEVFNDVSSTSVVNNHVYGSHLGISFGCAKDCIASGNTVQAAICGYEAAESSDISITGNTYNGQDDTGKVVGRTGIGIWGKTPAINTTASGNTLTKCSARMIDIQNSIGTTISGNTVSNHRGDIMVYAYNGASDVSITNNILSSGDFVTAAIGLSANAVRPFRNAIVTGNSISLQQSNALFTFAASSGQAFENVVIASNIFRSQVAPFGPAFQVVPRTLPRQFVFRDNVGLPRPPAP